MTRTRTQAELSPLADQSTLTRVAQMRASPDAPSMTSLAGDRLLESDIFQLQQFREQIRSFLRQDFPLPRATILDRVERWRKTVPIFQKLLKGFDLSSDWNWLPTTSREDLATAPVQFCPDDESLERLIVYRTSGTTGHPLIVPHHPQAIGAYSLLMEEVLRREGLTPVFEAGRLGSVLVGVQAQTITYLTALSVLNHSLFAKLNLPRDNGPESQKLGRWFMGHPVQWFTGDPLSLHRLAQLGVGTPPLALFSTAVAMSPKAKDWIERTLQAPVLQWYSLTETGPLAYIPVGEETYRWMAPDIYVECLDVDGFPVEDGAWGEITVSGGRNPFLPLVRYRTGDWGVMRNNRLVALEGRKPERFQNSAGDWVHSNDVSRLMRELPILQYEWIQRSDLSLEVALRLLNPSDRAGLEQARSKIIELMGEAIPLRLSEDPSLGLRAANGKVRAMVSEVNTKEILWEE